MKATLTTAAQAVNPEYTAKAHRQAITDGKPYTVMPYVTFEPGTELDDPQAWIHCVPGHRNAAPIAEPADDECRERVARWMEQERPQALERIKLMIHPVNLRKLDKKQREHVLGLAEVYGLQPEDGITEGENDGTTDGE